MMSLQSYAYYDSGDYEINNHTRGISLSFTDQINPQNLLQLEGSYTTATGARIYNEQMFAYSRYYGNEFAQLSKDYCSWPTSRQNEKCDEEAINRSAFVSWVDCRL